VLILLPFVDFKKGEKLVPIAKSCNIAKLKNFRSMHVLALCVFANRQKGEIVVRAIIFFVYLTNLQKHTIIEFYGFFYLCKTCRQKTWTEEIMKTLSRIQIVKSEVW